jgi:hypothetical protein
LKKEKEQQKKGKKTTTTKKKDDKTVESKAEDATPAEDSADTAPPAEQEKAEGDETVLDDSTKADTSRKMSISVQSKQRSESFRQGTAPLSPGVEVQDLYRKQAARIEELEKESRTYREQNEEGTARLAKAEEELESLREGSSDMADLKTKAKDADRLRAELTSVQRQLAQAQQSAKGSSRRVSGTSPDLTEQLDSKTSTIESLELEMSNLRNQMNSLQTTIAERDASAKELEERAVAAESSTESVKQELDALKVSIAFPSDETKAANEDPEALTKRITVLESGLRTANINLDAAAKRATSLEQKIEALTKLHRDANAVSQAKDKELTELRTQLRRRERASHVRDASEFELGEEETETGALQARIRALEAENFDLRRGVWKEKRAELQPGMDDDSRPSPEYEDVDLNGPYSPHASKGMASRHTSSFQDVITSGISAFTGRPREPARGHGYSQSQAQGRKQSLGLLSEDGDEIDPEVFRLAQEEESKRRIERVKEVKRGLEKWKGWRVDITEMRQGGVGGGRECGPVFEI